MAAATPSPWILGQDHYIAGVDFTYSLMALLVLYGSAIPITLGIINRIKARRSHANTIPSTSLSPSEIGDSPITNPTTSTTTPIPRHSWPSVIFHKLSLVTIPWYPTPLPMSSIISFISLCLLITLFTIGTGTDITYDAGYPRFGVLALGCITASVLLALRNSVMDAVFQFPFEKTLTWHRWTGTGAVVLIAVHGGLFFREWVAYKYVSENMKDRPRVFYGVIASAILATIFLTSLPPIRRKLFSVFYFVHVLSIPILLVLVNLHTDYAWNYTIAIAFFWGLDRVLRFWKSRVKVRVMKLELWKVSITGWHPISFASSCVRSQVVEVSEGKDDDGVVSESLKSRVTNTTVAATAATSCCSIESLDDEEITPMPSLSGSNDTKAKRTTTKTTTTSKKKPFTHDCGVTLIIRGVGSFSKTLHDRVRLRQNLGIARPLKVRIDGPYGRPSFTPHCYPIFIAVAGGIGITPVLSMALTALRVSKAIELESKDDSEYHLLKTRVVVIWCVRHASDWRWTAPDLIAAAELGAEVWVHVTRDSTEFPLRDDFGGETAVDLGASSSSGLRIGEVEDEVVVVGGDAAKEDVEDEEDGREAEETTALKESVITKFAGDEREDGFVALNEASKLYGIHIVNTRPNYGDAFSRLKALCPNTDVGVAACGPNSLVTSVHKAARISSDRTSLFHLHTESFRF
ncbi:hypothetical protein HDU76_002373 [Blyttiomyces sp. JEL0837]|nr:hypothetical protein HDU76_002373 [Blyttiomyces sp. JEL0837]